MKQKTAIRQLIENSLNRDLAYWKLELLSCSDSTDERSVVCNNMIGGLETLLKEAKQLEPLNEKQIKDAFTKGADELFSDRHQECRTGEQYFNDTFIQ